MENKINEAVKQTSKAVQEALLEAVNKLKTDKEKQALPLIFMIGVKEGLEIEDSLEQSEAILANMTEKEIDKFLAGVKKEAKR